MDRINWVVMDALRAVAELSAADTSAVTEEHARMRGAIDLLARRARQAGYAEDETRLVTFAVAALADETAMARGGPMRDGWSTQPLQLVYFGDTLAGEHFFRHLERARRDGLLDVVRVHYLCLALGFRGRYAAREHDAELAALTESVRVELTEALPMPEVLAPDAHDPEQGAKVRCRELPIVSLALGLLAAVALLLLGLAASLHDQARLVAQRAAAGEEG